MRTCPMNWSKFLIAILWALAPIATANAAADTSLVVETIQPSRIKVGDTATIKVTSMDGYMESIPLPTVTGLTFEVIQRSRGFEFVNGVPISASFILIKVTPQFAGVFTIPGLVPNSKSLGLEVVK